MAAKRKNGPKRPREVVLRIMLVAAALVSALAVFIVVFFAIHPIKFNNEVDISADKPVIDQEFSTVTLPANLQRVSSNYQTKSFAADGSSLYSYPEKLPWWTYIYTVSGAPSTSKALADSIMKSLAAQGYTFADNVYDRPVINANRPSPSRKSFNDIIEVQFNDVNEGQDFPLSRDYPVQTVTFISYEE